VRARRRRRRPPRERRGQPARVGHLARARGRRRRLQPPPERHGDEHQRHHAQRPLGEHPARHGAPAGAARGAQHRAPRIPHPHPASRIVIA
jgi:hypothetical protein